MDPIANPKTHQEMKILRMVQETRLIAVVEVMVDEEEDTYPREEWIIVDSNLRPMPVPYSEEP